MTRRQKLTYLATAAILLLMGAIAVTIVITGREGTSAIEQWIGRQLVGVLESYTTATADFATLDYQAPGTVIVTGMTLSAAGRELVAADRLLLQLAEPPKPGKPIQIQRIELDAPRFNFVRAAGGGFVGWSGFVRPEVVADPDSVKQAHRLSEVLVLRHVEIRNGRMIYDAGDGTEPMVLSGITTVLETIPDPGDPGWYNLDGKLSRAPVFDADIDARINLDTSHLDIERLTLSIALDEGQYEVFPPQIQAALRDHEVRGDLAIQLQSSIALKQWQTGTMTLDVTLLDARVAFGENVLPVESVALHGVLTDSTLRIDLDARLLGGELRLQATTALSGVHPMELTWNLSGIKIERTIRELAGRPPSYAGTIRSTGRLGADLTNWPNAVDGGGTINIEDGRLVLLPGMNDLFRLVGVGGTSNRASAKDRANFKFDFQPGGIRITEGKLVSEYVAARIRGTIDFAGQLDLDVNAGPLEKVQSMLGIAGELFGKLTDKLITYRVRGPITHPEVSIKPFAADISK